ncbi:Actin protein 2/3 complex subunit 3 [Paragonimus heterotremus]|uniref:Actin-related protein 2/3 complex subunit 3 n=1 Tax=Paragonimus heterotremus TaxID=100268 RepID=A0A8J4WEY4_9TREM|nr:Actin protein 2/3 complex subunit 3 [Paragonimus heterotremus]
MANYHSQFVPAPNTVGNMALLPLRTKVRGPAPAMPDMDRDIIDEALYLFKSLIFFRQYEIRSESDRVLVYLILYILECLKKIQKCPNKSIASKELLSMAIARFDLPGDPGFPRELNNLYAKPKTQAEMDQMRSYMSQLRQEIGVRLVELVYPSDTCPPSKWWTCFAKRRFLDQSLTPPGAL